MLFKIFAEAFWTAILYNTCKQQLPLLKAFTEVTSKFHNFSNKGSFKNDFGDFTIDFPVEEPDFT